MLMNADMAPTSITRLHPKFLSIFPLGRIPFFHFKGCSSSLSAQGVHTPVGFGNTACSRHCDLTQFPFLNQIPQCCLEEGNADELHRCMATFI